MLVTATRKTVREWAHAVRAGGETVALVPTMGSLHRGHASLVDLARAHADRVAISIFVNPLQFGPGEDFERYPRDIEGDLETMGAAGVDLVFTPEPEEIYPSGEGWVAVVPERGADVLCGRSRPGHFRGVLTVVAKLFGIFAPDVAVFGQKDFQQLTLIRRMVRDLEMPIRIEAGPTVREPDGLALSSRNRYLAGEDRRNALALVGSLRACEKLFSEGVTDPAAFRAEMRRAGGSGLSLEYGEVVDPDTLEPVDRVSSGSVCVVAGRVGATRLIDNVILRDLREDPIPPGFHG